jgi:hypothetical protein
LDVFALRDRLIGDYADYVRSFIEIRDSRIREQVQRELEAGRLWPDPLIQLNPGFEPGGSVDDLVAEGLLHDECRRIFQREKDSAGGAGKPLSLRRVIARWFFMCSLTGRYTGSPESDFEFDLAGLRDVQNAEGFVAMLDSICEAALPNDYWSITLPTELATSSSRSPSLYAYQAALVLDEARALFSDQKIEALLEPSVHATSAAAERHHLFPKAHLHALGIKEIRDTNQIANFALVEWGDNRGISSKAPREYLPILVKRLTPEERVRQYRWHALPDGWEDMEYKHFLSLRRERVARFIGEAFRKLSGAPASAGPARVDIEDLVRAGEGDRVEFKSTLRTNRHTGQADPKMELACLKTIAGFLNSQGGTLVVGVSDDGETVGISEDGFPSEDKMNLHLVHLVRDRIGAHQMMYVHPRFEDRDEERVLVVECWKSNSAVFVKDGAVERFYVRTGAATTELSASQTQEYIRRRF